MSLEFEIYQFDDHHIYVVLQGQVNGLIHFANHSAFELFMRRYFDFIEDYEGQVLIETPIPEPFIDAFDDRDVF